MKKRVPRQPQQNGVAERMNKTLNKRARSMRLYAGLPQMFWAKAVNTAAHLINTCPSTPLNFKLPKEVWSGKKVNLSYLKVFGCVSYLHIDSTARISWMQNLRNASLLVMVTLSLVIIFGMTKQEDYQEQGCDLQ